MRKWIICGSLIFLTACSTVKDNTVPSQHSADSPKIHNTINTNRQQNKPNKNDPYSEVKDSIINKYKNRRPQAWGEALKGINRHIDTNQKVIALTFDACGGKHGSAYDVDIINYLTLMKIPATLFMNSRWIDANHNTFMTLSKSPLFEIENHGYLHKPLSVTGRSAYGIKGTKDIGEVVDEVLLNHNKIEQLTGKRPKFFRAGTAFYDDVAVNIAHDLGETPVGYSVLGDAGATYNTQQVKHALQSAKPGSIVILHMNQPTGFTAEGLKAGIPELIKKGFKFVKLSELPLKE